MSFDDDYRVSEEPCPTCAHVPTHCRDCEQCSGEGWTDPAEDDPINYIAGYESWPCGNCFSTGLEHWCPKCGESITRRRALAGIDARLGAK